MRFYLKVSSCAKAVTSVGLFAPNIEDLQVVIEIVALKDNGSLQETSVMEARIAVTKTPLWRRGGPEVSCCCGDCRRNPRELKAQR